MSNLRLCSIAFLFVLSCIVESAVAQPFVPGTYQGFSWLADDELMRGANRVIESRCVDELNVTVDSGNNWSAQFAQLACGGRITESFGHSEYFESEFDSGNVPGSLPLVNHGGLLFELFLDSEDNPGTPESVGPFLVSPNRSFAMRANADFEDDGDTQVLETEFNVFARMGTMPLVSDIAGEYQFANRNNELDTVNEVLATQVFLTVTFDGAGGCTIQNAPITGFTGDPQVNVTSYRTLADSGNAANQVVSFEPESLGNLPCTYSILGDGRLAVTVGPPGDVSTLNFVVSDDRRYLVPARDSDPSEQSDELRMMIRTGGGVGALSNSTLDGTFLFYRQSQVFRAGGTGLSGGGPAGGHDSSYVSGALIFDSSIARVGPDGEAGWSGCGMPYQSRTAAHRFFGDPATGALTNRLVDAQRDLAADSCAYKVDGDGGVLIEYKGKLNTGSEFTRELHGYVSDNGEVLLMQGQFGIPIDEPGFETNYRLFLHQDLTAVRYEGDLRGDANQDGTSNLGEFLSFAQGPSANVFPLSPSSKNAVVLDDATGNGVQEVGLLRPASNGQIFVETRDASGAGLLSNVSFLGASFDPVQVVRIPDFADTRTDELGVLGVRKSNGSFLVQVRDGSSGVRIANVSFLGAGFTPICVAVVPDINNNGRSELAVLALRKSDNAFIVQVRDSGDGELIDNNYYLGPGFEPKGLVILPDSDGNGIVEAGVLAVSRTNGSFLVQVRNISGPPMARNIFYLGSTFTPLAVAYVPDVDDNGIGEIAILAEKNSDLRFAVQTRNAFGAAMPHTSFFLGLGFEPLGLAILNDADGNGTPEAAVYAQRASDGRFLAEVRNLNGPRMPNPVFFMDSAWAPLELISVDDRDGNGTPDLGAIGERNSDSRIKMQMRNAAGAKNALDVWFAP